MYPAKKDKSKREVLIFNLVIKNKNNPDRLKVKLTGPLDLTGFSNLKKLWCSEQKITSLNLSDCPQLEELQC